MRGPSLQYDLRIQRTWKCSACGRVVCTRGRETSKTCPCTTPPIFMQLVEAPRRVAFDATAFVSPAEPDVDEDGPDGLEEATAAAMAAILARAEAAAPPPRSSFAESLARLTTSPGPDRPDEALQHGAESVSSAEGSGDDGSSPSGPRERSSAERGRSPRHRIPQRGPRQGGPAPAGSDRRTPRNVRRPAQAASSESSAERDSSGSDRAIANTTDRAVQGQHRPAARGRRPESASTANADGPGVPEENDSVLKVPPKKSRRRRRQAANTDSPADGTAEATDRTAEATDRTAVPAERDRNRAGSGAAAAPSGIESIRGPRPAAPKDVPSFGESDTGGIRGEASAGADDASEQAVGRRSRRRGRRRGHRSGQDVSGGSSATEGTDAS